MTRTKLGSWLTSLQTAHLIWCTTLIMARKLRWDFNKALTSALMRHGPLPVVVLYSWILSWSFVPAGELLSAFGCCQVSKHHRKWRRQHRVQGPCLQHSCGKWKRQVCWEGVVQAEDQQRHLGCLPPHPHPLDPTIVPSTTTKQLSSFPAAMHTQKTNHSIPAFYSLHPL